jgi:GNAT acetyltransferase-like protein
MDLISCTAGFHRASGAGYASREYAESLQEFGDLRELSRCRGWLLTSQTPNPNLYDAVGCYPLFCCHDWSALGADLEAMADSFVSVRLVTDPFAEVDVSQLQATFPDVCYEYKHHFVTDLTMPLETIVANHHRRNVRKALDALTIRQTTADAEFFSDWEKLYDNLVARHGIQGVARFSRMAFRRQATVPGFTVFSAADDNGTCGVTLWYVQGNVAYYHLGAYSDRGYERGASFALFWTALDYFAGMGVRWAALGAGAGLTSADSGLTRFKRGWATHSRPAYFCGRILQPAAYATLTAGTTATVGFFPAYRAA